MSSDIRPRLKVSTARYWYDHGRFKTEEGARAAFFLAYQQGLDGMGTSIAEWMGLTDDEYNAWIRKDELPKQKRKRRSTR